jgi:hypothetical protein
MRSALMAMALASAMGFASNAWAVDVPGFHTGKDLYDDCLTADQGSYPQGSCYGYIAGVVDADQEMQIRGSRLLPLCLSRAVTLQQAHDVVLKFLIQHPETRNLQAATIVWSALHNAFPCG